MIKFDKKAIITAFFVAFALGAFGPVTTFAAGPAAVNLGSSANFVILAKTGISTTGSTSIVGDIGASPAAATYITGFGLTADMSNTFSTSALVTGKIYAADYTVPTPTTMTTAISDMETAYTDAAGRTNPTATELGAGNIGGMTLAPGLYKWSTNVTIPTDVTLSGGPNDVWIFQVAGNLIMSSATHIILSGGAQAGNVFWVVAGQTTIGTTTAFNGNILDQTTIVLNTGATLTGRALAQAAVTLDSNEVYLPSAVVSAPQLLSTSTSTTTLVPTLATTSPMTCSNLYWSDSTNATCQSQRQFCGAYMYQGLQTFNSQQDCLNSSAVSGVVASGVSSNPNTALQIQLEGLLAMLHSLQAQAAQQGGPVSGQQVRSIMTNLGMGSGGADVTTLQQFLISQNKGPAAVALASVGATGRFGALTYAALAEFQKSVGIASPILGDFGPITRSYISTHF